MPERTIIIIGNGKSVKDCIGRLQAFNQQHPTARYHFSVINDTAHDAIGASLKGYYQREGIANFDSADINGAAARDHIQSIDPDYLVSINNHQIIKKGLIRLPRSGVINFHNAPLPRYGGLNACTWAIVNGETEHGVTWHFIDEGVDTGDIIVQKFFPIGPDTTAIQLIMQCITEGVRLFDTVLGQMMQGSLSRTPQDPDRRLFYRHDQIPNDGYLDFKWPYRQFDNFVRGLNFGPFPNPLQYPLADFAGRQFSIDKIRFLKDNQDTPAGQIVKADGQQLVVAVEDALIDILAVRTGNGRPLGLETCIREYGLGAGDRFSPRPAGRPGASA